MIALVKQILMMQTATTTTTTTTQFTNIVTTYFSLHFTYFTFQVTDGNKKQLHVNRSAVGVFCTQNVPM